MKSQHSDDVLYTFCMRPGYVLIREDRQKLFEERQKKAIEAFQASKLRPVDALRFE